MDQLEKRLMTVKDVCKYTGWGKTKAREIISDKNSTFTIRVGRNIYVDKKKFDEFLDNCIKFQITIR